MSTLKKQYFEKVQKQMQEKYSYPNPHQIPKLTKIILHRGLGEATSNSKVVELSVAQFEAISGQKPQTTVAKKSISNFKVREGQVIGCRVTLRADKMYDFLTKLINVVLPKIRDFRGVPRRGFDGRGNYTFGLKEDIIFPEVDFNKLDKLRGMDVTIVTSATSDEEAFDLLAFLGMPFVQKVVAGQQG